MASPHTNGSSDDKDKLKPPSRGEKVDDQNEEADDTGLYDREEDMYNQDADPIDQLDEDG